MPKFRAKATTFYDGRLISAGEEFEYSGEPGDNLEPVDDAARSVYEEAAAKRRVEAERIKRSIADAVPGVAFDSTALELKIEQAIGRVNAVEASAKAAAEKAVADIAELDAGLSAVSTKLDALAAQFAALAAQPAPAPAPAPVEPPIAEDPVAETPAVAEPTPADPAPVEQPQ